MRPERFLVRSPKFILLAVIGLAMNAAAQPQQAAFAGFNKIYLLSDSIRLMGLNASTMFETDSVRWTLISGQSTAQILSPESSITRVTLTDTGVYSFEFRMFGREYDTASTSADTIRLVIRAGRLPSAILAPLDSQEVEIGMPFRIRWRTDPWVPCRISYRLDGWTADSLVTPDTSIVNGYSGVLWNVDSTLPTGVGGIVTVFDVDTPAHAIRGGFTLVSAQSPQTPIGLKAGGTPIVSCTNPSGAGNSNIGLIRDNVYPITGSFYSSYDTFDGFDSIVESYFGYTFPIPCRFSKMEFLIGAIDIGEGGLFVAPRIEVLRDSAWVEVADLQSDPVWDIKFPPFTSVAFTFTPIEGTGIRIIGMEQSIEPYVSCAELDVEGIPLGELQAVTLRESYRAPLVLSAAQSGGGIVFAIPLFARAGGIKSRIEIRDLAGRSLWAIDCADRAFVLWDRRTEGKRKAPPGLYIARLIAGNRSAVARIPVR